MGQTATRWVAEAHWAWRNVRLRGSKAILAMALLALAIAANAVVFAIADALVFHRAPYPDVERLVELRQTDQTSGRSGTSLPAAVLDEWRKQTDIFQGVAGHLYKIIFLTGRNSETELVN